MFDKHFTLSAAKMIRTLALICAVATTASGLYSPNLRVRFDMSPIGFGTNAFIEIPKSNSSAADKGWVVKTPPEGPEVLALLKLWCPSDDYSICVFFDDTGCVAGLQIAFDQEKVSDAVYDWTVQGYKNWTTTLNGTTKNYHTTHQYYISKEILDTDPATRIASRNSSIFLQHGGVWVSSFNGDLYKVSSTAVDITGPDSIFIEQGCLPRMGTHYYYNMTSSLGCSGEEIFPWFPLISEDQLIGIGFNVFAVYTVCDDCKDWFEHSGELILRLTVPRGPDCLYDLSADVGQVTLHIYFIDNPSEITCLV